MSSRIRNYWVFDNLVEMNKSRIVKRMMNYDDSNHMTNVRQNYKEKKHEIK